jgi:hypothetical protein
MITLSQNENNNRFTISGLDGWDLEVIIRALFNHQSRTAKCIINIFEQDVNNGKIKDEDVKDIVFSYAAHCK